MNESGGPPAGERDAAYSVLERRILEMFILAGDVSSTVDLPQGRENDLRGLLDDGLLRMVPAQRPSASSTRQGYALTPAGRAYVQTQISTTPEATTFRGPFG